MKSILVTTDGSSYAGEAIELACDLAEKHKASLKLLHVFLKDKAPADLLRLPLLEDLGTDVVETLRQLDREPANRPTAAELMRDPNRPDKYAPHDILAAIGDGILTAAQRQVRARGLDCDVLAIGEGDTAQCIVESARREQIDTIVMGSRGLGSIEAMTFGSVSQTVCHDAPCTCIMVH